MGHSDSSRFLTYRILLGPKVHLKLGFDLMGNDVAGDGFVDAYTVGDGGETHAVVDALDNALGVSHLPLRCN